MRDHQLPGEGAALSLRDRKKLQTRLLLESAALQLFLDRGFAETTLDELVGRVGVSKRTFFRLYPSKEEVAVAAETELWDAYVEAVARGELSGSVLHFLRTRLVEAIESRDAEWDRRFVATRGLIARTPALWDRSSLLSMTTQARVTEQLERKLGIDSGDDVRLRLLGEVSLAAWRCAARNWIAGRGPTGRGPYEKLGTWRGPGRRRGLVRSVEEAFDAIPASLSLSAGQ